MALQIPELFLQQFSSPSGGDAYTIPVFAGLDTAERSKRVYRASGPNEVPIWGGRRVANLLPSSMLTVGIIGMVNYVSSGYALTGLDNPTIEAWPGPAGRPNTALRMRGPVHNILSWMFYRSQVLGTPVPSSRRVATSCFMKAGPDHGGFTPIIYNHVGPAQYCVLDGEWRRYGTAAYNVTVPGGEVRQAIGCNPSTLYAGTIMDVILSMDPEYPFQIEDLTGCDQPGASEPVNPYRNYGFGVPGVRWFDNVCPCTRDAATGRMYEVSSTAPIPDCEGIRPQFAASNLLAYSSLHKGSSGGAYYAENNFLHVGSRQYLWGDLWADRIVSVASGPAAIPQIARGALAVSTVTRCTFWGIAKCVSSTHPWVGAQVAYFNPAGSLQNAAAVFNLQTGQGSVSVEYFPADTLGSCTAIHLGNSFYLCALMLTVTGSASATAYFKFPSSAGAIGVAAASGALLDIFHLQFERSAMPTAAIVTSGAAGSRLADNFVINSIYCGSEWTGFCEFYYPPEGIVPEVTGQAWVRLWGTIGQEVGAVMARANGQVGHGLAARYMAVDARTVGVHRIVTRYKDGAAGLWFDGVAVAPMSAAPSSVGFKAIAAPQQAGTITSMGMRQLRLWPVQGLPDEMCMKLSRGEVDPP